MTTALSRVTIARKLKTWWAGARGERTRTIQQTKCSRAIPNIAILVGRAKQQNKHHWEKKCAKRVENVKFTIRTSRLQSSFSERGDSKICDKQHKKNNLFFFSQCFNN